MNQRPDSQLKFKMKTLILVLKGPDSGGLVILSGSQGCILSHSDPSGPWKVPSVLHPELQGIKVFPYLDDILFSTDSKQALSAHINPAVHTLAQAGFINNRVVLPDSLSGHGLQTCGKCNFKMWDRPNINLFMLVHNCKLPPYAPFTSPQR